MAAAATRRFDIKAILPGDEPLVNDITRSRQWWSGGAGFVAYRGAIVSRFLRHVLLGLPPIFLVAAGCGGSGDQPEVVAPDLATDIVTVDTPGTGEATELRWEPRVGDAASFEIVIGIDTVVELDELRQEAEIGPAAMTFDAVVSAVGEAGEITTDYVVVDAGVLDGGDPGLEEVMAAMVGTTVTETLSATGLPIAVHVTPAEPLGAAEQAQFDRFVRQLSAVFTPLPTQAVGVGATWTFAREVNIQGVVWLDSTSYTLLALDGSNVQLDVEHAQFAEFQQVDPAGPTSLEGTIEGLGRNDADLTAIAPRDFESATRLEAAIFTEDRKTGRTANQTESTLRSVDSGS